MNVGLILFIGKAGGHLAKTLVKLELASSLVAVALSVYDRTFFPLNTQAVLFFSSSLPSTFSILLLVLHATLTILQTQMLLQSNFTTFSVHWQ